MPKSSRRPASCSVERRRPLIFVPVSGSRSEPCSPETTRSSMPTEVKSIVHQPPALLPPGLTIVVIHRAHEGPAGQAHAHGGRARHACTSPPARRARRAPGRRGGRRDPGLRRSDSRTATSSIDCSRVPRPFVVDERIASASGGTTSGPTISRSAPSSRARQAADPRAHRHGDGRGPRRHRATARHARSRDHHHRLRAPESGDSRCDAR